MRAQHSKGFMRCRSGEARWKTNENARALIIHDGPEHKPLQSEAGYIDARPQSRQIDETSCDARPDHTSGSRAPFSRCPQRVRSTSDCGTIAAAQRTDVEGHNRPPSAEMPSRSASPVPIQSGLV